MKKSLLVCSLIAVTLMPFPGSAQSALVAPVPAANAYGPPAPGTNQAYGPPMPTSYTQQSAGGYWGSNQQGSGDCDPIVAKRQDMARKASIGDWEALSSRTHSNMPSAGFTGLACLDSLLNSNLNIFGNLGLADILGRLEQGLCSALGSLVQSGTSFLLSPINQAINGALPTGQLIPGVDLGSLSGGMLLSPNIGGASSPGSVSTQFSGSASGVPVNVRTMFDPVTGQMTQGGGSYSGYSGPPSYGPMFGRSPAMGGNGNISDPTVTSGGDASPRTSWLPF